MSGALGQGVGMRIGVRLASLTLVFALVAACTGQAASSAAAPAASAPPATITSRESASPCTVGLTLLEAFTQRLADDLASLRPLATAATFDSAATVVGIRRVSATMTAFAGLDKSLQACDLTVDLATQVETLTSSRSSKRSSDRSRRRSEPLRSSGMPASRCSGCCPRCST